MGWSLSYVEDRFPSGLVMSEVESVELAESVEGWSLSGLVMSGLVMSEVESAESAEGTDSYVCPENYVYNR